MTRSRCQVDLFGALRVRHCGRVITHFETRKTAALLAYLAYHPHRGHPREVLAEMLWPEQDPDATRVRLRQALAALRRALQPAASASPPGAASDASSEENLLLADRLEVRLDPGAVTTDVQEFEHALRQAAHAADAARRAELLRRAVDLYQGELLPGYYEDWVVGERERLAEAYLSALARLAEALTEAGDLAAASDYARRAVTADPLREESHAALMRAYLAAGRTADALRQYRELARVLHADLGTGPSPATQALARAIEQSSAGTGGPVPSPPHRLPHETPGGAVPLGSAFYIVRPGDARFETAIARRDSIVLVKGPRQVGKTSLLARGLQRAREGDARVVLTDLQKLTAAQVASGEALFFTLAEAIADELGLAGTVRASWDDTRGWNVNFERFVRRKALTAVDTHLVWGLDEVDRLFGCPYGSEVFGLFRSWHNERALDPAAPWSRITLAIAYSTEAHLFITDLNQSPFNVGTRVTLGDFTPDQVAELNRRYGSRTRSGRPPLQNAAELARFYALVGGNPYLVRRGLYEMAGEGLALPELEAQTALEEGVFHDPLRRMLVCLTRDALLCDAMREVLRRGHCPDEASFYRLRSAGLVTGESPMEARPRCGLYRDYLERHLG